MRKKRRSWVIVILGSVLCLNLLAGTALFGQPQMRILVSNDDGIDHPGMQALVVKLSPLGEVTVAAPSKNQSGVGHGTTFPGPIRVEAWERGGVKWYSIEALPATCVRIALTSLLSADPDILVAGVNKGANVGVITFSSGTVACAREAAYRGIPALSVNLERGTTMDYDAAADFIAAFVPELKKKGLPRGTYLNINIPALPKDQIKGALITTQDFRPPDEYYERKTNAEGKMDFWSVYKVLGDGDPKSDTWALSHGYISITPLVIDQTDHLQVKTMAAWKVVNLKKQGDD
jgi:5'-nucleotidase